MARSLDDLYQFMLYIVRKERGVFITTTEATAALDNGQMDAFGEYFKIYGGTQVVHDALRSFRVYYQFTTDAAGFVTFPEGYLHLLGGAFTVTGSTVNEVVFYNEDEFTRALISQLRPVSNTNPIAKDTSTGFSIYPQSLQVGFFNYLKRPATPNYVSIVNGRQIIYDNFNSVNLEWSDAYLNNIVARALKYVGVNMNEEGVYAFAESYKKETE